MSDLDVHVLCMAVGGVLLYLVGVIAVLYCLLLPFLCADPLPF
jgi:hypothetical protein